MANKISYFKTLMVLGIVIGSWGMSTSTTMAQEHSPVGLWNTVSDKTGRVLSLVKIALVEGKLVGTIQDLFRKPEQNQNPLCTKCSDERKDQPLRGMKIVWDLTKDDDEWNDGYILDPDNGTTYSCFVKINSSGDKLEVRGYVGFSLFGRTQIWERAK